VGEPFTVQRKQCRTCIYRRDSPLDLKALEAAIADPRTKGFFAGYRICHHSKSAFCRGFWNRHKNYFALGQIVQRLGGLVEVSHND
jgi:hypothetical protein